MTNHLVNSADSILSKPFIKKKRAVQGYWTIWHIGAGIGLLGGTFLLACAAFLTIFQFFYSEAPHGSWLFAVVLPLWVFGAHCFDKVEEEINRIRKSEYYEQHGIREEKSSK